MALVRLCLDNGHEEVHPAFARVDRLMREMPAKAKNVTNPFEVVTPNGNVIIPVAR